MASFGDFQQFLQREQITVLNLPVSYWQEWVLELSHSGTHLPPTLRVQIVGSEQVPPDRLVDWQQLAGDDVAWYNAYGPTEATITTTIYHPGKQRENKDAATVSIGRPISNVQIYILDQYLQPTPIGVPGELHIGGMSLARGYLHHFMLTAEKFIPHPFSDTPGARLYKTGDLARYRSDGSIECLGRIDQQVKIRGFRIELGEIEAALRRHPSVREAIASVYGDNQRGKRLLAYVVTEPGTRCQPSELRTFLWQHLPGHMIPSSYMFINEMPRMPNGKVDRHALPVPDGINFERESAFALPQTVTEEALTRIWTQVLGVKRIGIHDNFFELGGDSILSIQIVARARQAGIHLNLQHLFQHQTIAELAAVAGVGVPVQAEQGLVTGMVPFTPIQKWFFEQPLACLHHYNQARLLLVQKPLELGLLEQAVQQLLTHHDALRMRFFLEPQTFLD
jgi:aryl carrier-like protein